MRYRSARIVPGVNPPTGIESLDIIRATWGLAAGDFGDSPPGDSTVGNWEGELIGCPQERQNLLSAGICAEHFGHCTIDGEVIGFYESHRLYAISWGQESNFSSGWEHCRNQVLSSNPAESSLYVVPSHKSRWGKLRQNGNFPVPTRILSSRPDCRIQITTAGQSRKAQALTPRPNQSGRSRPRGVSVCSPNIFR
jgi:hypothetical protein